MFELNLYKRKFNYDISPSIWKEFDEPIIFYLMDKRDEISFFLSFVIIDDSKQEVIFLDTYSEENMDVYNKLNRNEKFVLRRTPHRTVVIERKKFFYTFVQDENFFFYVDYDTLKAKVMTLDELLDHTDYKIDKISASIFNDYYNQDYLYISAIDTEQNLHVYHASIDLQEIVEIYTEENHRVPPHSIVNYKNCLYLSHDFGNVDFRNLKKSVINNSDEVVRWLNMQVIRKKIIMKNKNYSENEIKAEVAKTFLNDAGYVVEQGKVTALDLNTYEMKTYNTSGSSPAHFEFDYNENCVYIVSHNFFGWEGNNIFISPAVIDKFEITNDGLKLLKSFVYEKGFRYATHKIFYRKEKCYICTLAQPNRLIVVDTSTMQLEFYFDIEEDVLSDKDNVRDYLNGINNNVEFVSILSSKNGNYLIIMSNNYIYYFDIDQKCIAQKIKYNEKDSTWVIRTIHADYI